jgi:hypothetical protein
MTKAFHNLFDKNCPICGLKRGFPIDHSKCSKILQQQRPNQPTERSDFAKKKLAKELKAQKKKEDINND